MSSLNNSKKRKVEENSDGLTPKATVESPEEASKRKRPPKRNPEALLISVAARESHFPESPSRVFVTQRRFGDRISFA